MGRKKKGTNILPGIGWRILSFIPYFNWIAVIRIGKYCSSRMDMLFGVLYGVLTFFTMIGIQASEIISTLIPIVIWIVSMAHYSVVCMRIKQGWAYLYPAMDGVTSLILRVLSIFPFFNWISLILIGEYSLNVSTIVCGAAYGIVSFTVLFVEVLQGLIFICWILAIFQYHKVRKKYQSIFEANQIIRQDEGKKEIPEQSTGLQIHPDIAMEVDLSFESNPDMDGVFEQIPADDKNELEYVDIILSGEDEQKQAIPPKEEPPALVQKPFAEPLAMISDSTISTAMLQEGDVDVFEGFGYPSHRKFFKDMEQFVNRTGEQVPFVPFMHYSSTYDDMDRRQKAWYFYWRTEVRNGNYLHTDLSYLFIHVYELLSGYGWERAQDGYDQLISLWIAYREQFPTLDHYLMDWTFDFSLVHHLEYVLPEMQDMRLSYDQTIRDTLIDQHGADKPLKLSFVLIDSLCDYSMVGSKFYKGGHQLIIQEAIPRVVALADAALLKEKGKGILAVYGPKRPRKRVHYLYQSAVCPDANKRIEISIKAYSINQRLRSYLNELVRYAENILRGLYGYRGRLRGVTLNDETAVLVKAFLEKEYMPRSKQQDAATRKVTVKLDFDNIDELRVQSDAVRDALEVVEESQKELLTDLQEMKALVSEISPQAKHLLDQLYSGDWKCVATPEMKRSIEEINRLAYKYLACALLVRERSNLVVEDDYQDELDYIYANPAEMPEPTEAAFVEKEVERETESGFDLSLLSDEMQELVCMLTPVQQQTLHIILSHKIDELERIAEEEMTMPELLVDEINDTATQVLDDILIDMMDEQPCILEQYESELKRAMK